MTVPYPFVVVFIIRHRNRNLLSIDFNCTTHTAMLYDDPSNFTLIILYDEVGWPILLSPRNKYSEYYLLNYRTHRHHTVQQGNWWCPEHGSMAKSGATHSCVRYHDNASFVIVSDYAYTFSFSALTFPFLKQCKRKCGFSLYSKWCMS